MNISRGILLLVLGACLAAPAAYAQGPSGPGAPGRPAGRFGMAMRQLDLTDAQKEKMRDIREREERRDIQARADLQIARLDLRRLMSSERPEPGAIDAQIDRLARMRAERAKARVAAMLEARSLLTPEQQKQMRERRGGMGPGMRPGLRGMRGGGDGGGPGRRAHLRPEPDGPGEDGPQ